MNPRDHHCCQHNLACAWPYFTESLYEATPDRGLAAMMYAPCTVTARVGDGTEVTDRAGHALSRSKSTWICDFRVPVASPSRSTCGFPVGVPKPG